MAIQEADYSSEKELELWVKPNFSTFLDATLLLDGFSVTTPSGKRGIPDGFAFDFSGRAWYVIECELLQHRVWPHIAEQMVRFVVAMQNPISLRCVRDRVFEHIVANGMTQEVASDLDTVPERLLQKIELFVEGIRPHFLIFIDKLNRDLEDMANALDARTLIFRVQKFTVDGKPEYHCPDQNVPVFESAPDEGKSARITDFEVVQLLGGGELADGTGRFKCYRLADGSVANIKQSKLHKDNNYYWYGISQAALGYIDQYGVTHVIFVMGDHGFARVPIEVVREYLTHTKTSQNPDGSVRHYHCLISNSSEPDLYWSSDVPRYALGDYFFPFDK